MTTRGCMNAHIIGSSLLGTLIMLQTFCGRFTYTMDCPGHKSGDLCHVFYVSWAWWLFCFLPFFLYFLKQKGRSRKAAPEVDWVAFVGILFFECLSMFTLLAAAGSPHTDQGSALIQSFVWMVPVTMIVFAVVHASVRHENAPVAQ